jgi:hypothetical protein
MTRTGARAGLGGRRPVVAFCAPFVCRLTQRDITPRLPGGQVPAGHAFGRSM